MAKRKLRIVRRTPFLLGVCERCSAEFTGSMSEIIAAFDAHDCAPLDSSENAVPVVREATENK